MFKLSLILVIAFIFITKLALADQLEDQQALQQAQGFVNTLFAPVQQPTPVQYYRTCITKHAGTDPDGNPIIKTVCQ